MSRKYLAFDLGAESGRAIVGTLADGKLSTDVIHRFPTEGLTILGTRQWDITRIYEEIARGIALSVQKHGSRFDALSIDTWGVDYGLLAGDDNLLGNPCHYRDRRTEGMEDIAFGVIPYSEIYKRTGIVFQPFNTLYQLLAASRNNPAILKLADKFLFLGPLLGYWLTGKPSCEYTIASTAQMLKAGKLEWDTELLEALGIPTDFLPAVLDSEQTVGTLTSSICGETGISPETPYVTGAIHDTAAAVVAVPAQSDQGDWAYLSSGTWSLLGVELEKPLLSDEAREAGFTNEGGVRGKIRFLKNIFGLWVVQECRRAWVTEAGREDGLDYATLTAEAEKADPFKSIIDLEDKRFLAPENMPEMIQTLCRENNEPVPETRGAIIRCALESLALCYRRNLRKMDGILNRKTQRLHIIGGGVQNQLLTQFAADACGIPVQAGPVEATAIGNILVQAMATGALADLDEARKVVVNSFDVKTYEPKDQQAWDKAEARISN